MELSKMFHKGEAKLPAWNVSSSQFSCQEYRNANDHGHADEFFRLPQKYSNHGEDEHQSTVKFLSDETMEIHPVTEKTVRQSLSRDKTLSRAFLYSSSGWPEQLKKDEEMKTIFSRSI
jgi:hypothetical protein